MTDLKKTITKGALGTVAAGAMALASATPAMADNGRDRGGVDAGDIIAGAVIIGGIAALAGAFDNDRDDRYRDRDYRDRNYNYNYNYNYRDHRGYNYNQRARFGRDAVERCIHAAEYRARSWGGYRYANVTEIRDIDRGRYGPQVRGRIEVQGNGYRGRGYDEGRFTCDVDGRGNVQIDFDGIRRLR